MFSAQQSLLPLTDIETFAPLICSCRKCSYINYINNIYCTECGFPLHDDELINRYHQRISVRKTLKEEAQTSILITRFFLFCMGGFILSGAVYLIMVYQPADLTAVIIMAIMLSALFFILAFWSRKNPFTSLLTSFVILTTFSAINIFGKFTQTFTTLTGLIGMVICLVLLAMVLRGVQAAYRITMIDEELETA